MYVCMYVCICMYIIIVLFKYNYEIVIVAGNIFSSNFKIWLCCIKMNCFKNIINETF